MNLIAGATGILGSEICRLLAENRQPLRALVRSTSNPDEVAQLKALEAEVIVGDLKEFPIQPLKPVRAHFQSIV